MTPNPTPAAPTPTSAPTANLKGFPEPVTPPVPVKPPSSLTSEPVKEPTYDLNVDGQTVSLTAKQILAFKEKASQFDLTAKAKAELEKGIANLIAQIEQDPLGIYAKRGKDPKALIIDRFKKMIEEDQQDPKERELSQLRAEKDQRVKADEEMRKRQEDATKAAKQQELYGTILRDIDKQLTERALPKDHYSIDRILRLMASGKRVKGTNFSVAEAAEIFQKEEMKHIGFIAKQLPSERLKEMFGPDIIKKLNGEQIAALKAADTKVAKTNKTESKAVESKLSDEEKIGRASCR